jgi:peptidoglycan/xylan/chitin deacetylase (PgdA/CDA1 family)
METASSRYQGQALVTFSYDDGRRSAFENALPLHAAFNMAASFAIIAERTKIPRFRARYMSAGEVRAAAEAGVEICSHGLSHHRLTELPDAALDHELGDSRELLETMSAGRPVDALCVPFSAMDARVLAAAERHYETVRVHGRKFTPLSPKQRLVHAFGLTNKTTLGEITDLLDRAVAQKAWVTLMLHGVEKGTAAPQNPYDINTSLLEGILRHAQSHGPEKLLPVTFANVKEIQNRI